MTTDGSSTAGSDSTAADGRGRVAVDGARLAIGTLSAFPVPAPSRIDARVAGLAMAAAPAVGLALGGLIAAGLVGARALGLSDLIGAALGLGALALATRGLHLDGLADTADGLAASYDRDRALTVMRRGDVGPAGAATLVLVLLVQVAALSEALARGGALTVLLAVVASRAVLTIACSRGVPAARPEGLGAVVAESVARGTACVVLLATALAMTALAWAGPMPWWRGALTLLAAVTAAAAVLARARSRLGGITGDVLGACVEAALAAALLACAVG